MTQPCYTSGMFGLGKHGPDGRYGAIVDIGSGSVGVAIVASDPDQELPVTIWSTREWTSIRDLEQADAAAKDITAATMNAFLTLGSTGCKAMRAYDKKAKLTDIQVAIAAPWSYTITKTVSTTDEKEFEITESLIEELIETAKSEALAVIDQNDFMQKMGLEVISDATIGVTANGYLMKKPVGQNVKSVSISHLTGVTEQKLMSTIRDAKDQVFTGVNLKSTTFMYHYYLALQALLTESTEVCLVDVTAEAVELGIIRDGILKYVTHMPYGTRSIAREIAAVCDIPKEEAAGYLRSNNTDLIAALSDEKQTKLGAIIATFDERLADLLQRTGDALSIPKTIYLHTDIATEAFFTQRLEKAGYTANSVEHAVHPITSKLFQEKPNEDTALLLSAYVFHKKLHAIGFDAQ